MKSIHPNIIRQIFVLLLILVIGGLIFWEIVPYLTGVLGAVTLYVIFRKWMIKLIKKGWNPNIAAGLLMVVSFIGILIPVGGLIAMLGSKMGKAVEKSENVIEIIKDQLFVVEKTVDYDVSSQIDPSGASAWLTESVSAFAGSTFNLFISIAIMYFLLYYMLTNRKELKESLFEYIPISKMNLRIIGKEVQAMVRSNALGIPLVAVAQGLVALIGFFIFGIENLSFGSP